MLRDVENDLFDDFGDEDPDVFFDDDDEDFDEGGWGSCSENEEE